MKRIAVVVVTAGCSALFGIDKIPYEGDPGQPIELSVAISGSGTGMVSDDTGQIACSSGGNGTCAHVYDAGATITLTPAAGTSSAFFGWGQGCSDQNGDGAAQCTLTGASGLVYVVADFSPYAAGQNMLTLAPTLANHSDPNAYIMAGSNRCDDDGRPCGYALDPSVTSVTLTPVGDSCAPFLMFTGGGCAPATATCTVTFTPGSIQSVVVDFEFAANATGSGSNTCGL